MQALQCVFLIFHVFECFSPYYMSYSLCFLFSIIFNFLAILQVLQCVFLYFHVFECYSPYSMSNRDCVSFSTFFSFLTIFQVIQCAFLIFHIFQCFSPCSRSYSMRLIFHDFQFPCHTPWPTVCISPFPSFLVFLATFRSYTVCVSFSTFFSFLAIFLVL